MTVGVGGSSVEAELAGIRSGRDVVAPIGTEERLARIDRAQRRMREIGIPALWLDGTTDLEYFTGVRHGQTERMIGALLPQRGMPVYLCPAFEAAKLRTLLSIGDVVRVWEEDQSPYDLFLDMLRDLQIHSGTIALDEQARFFVTEGLRAAAAEAGADYRWTTGRAVSSWCRQRKSEHEIALIGQAMRMTLDIQEAAARILRPGITTTEVAAFLNQAHLKAGFDRSCLFAIALFGEATAYPHGVPHAQVLADGDMVLVDCGAPLHGYVSDITRSYVFGTPSDRQRQVWDLERAAQEAAFRAVRPGAPAGGVDDAARAVVVGGGFGPGYAVPGLPHRTGHGIGMDVHEEPFFVKGNTLPLEAGMCGSIEPMICLYGEFGVRLEDHVHVTETGAAWFTPPCPSVDDPFGVDRG